ncbi:hypothetical protein H0E84_07915 [Luteimonas sp. SJ-92]|uniref:DUF1449 family protein n=1 Tax=Luteimonas salinisoli TaxID=2752307 RepID=A0A853JCF1_9GAMM|nr:hypothetical protein [Luteimonas salinisoli]NZA26309.1 hypothetical protein [Luteimonas salinisoli]
MEEFLRIALSFPTVVFSLALGVMVALWLLAALGIFQSEALDGWALPDIDGMEPQGLTAVMMKFGLGGLPLMLVLTLLAFIAWLVSYFADYLLLRHLGSTLLRFPLGAVVLLVAFVAGVLGAGQALRPIRHFLARLAPQAQRSVIGMAATVRSPAVTATGGQATVEDGGAGLILQVRSDREGGFHRGDRVVLLEYLEPDNAYRVVGEDEFHGR